MIKKLIELLLNILKVDANSRRNGKLTPAAYEAFRGALPDFGAELGKQFPLNAKALKAIGQYYSGKGPRELATRAVHESLADLDEVAKWYSKDWERATSLSHHLRDLGKNFQGRLIESKQQFIALAESSLAAGQTREEIDRIILDTFYETIGQASNRLASSLASKLSQETIEVTDPWASSPGLAVANTLALHISRRSVSLQQVCTTKSSDFADTYHAIYIPYVDVFRADAFVASVIRECKLPFRTLVVDRFVDLSSKIESALADT